MSRKKGSIPWNKGIHMWKDKEHPRGMKGRKMSLETRRKMSLAAKGKPKSPEHIKNAADAHRGKKHISNTGENHPLWIKDRTKLQRYSDDAKDRRSSAYRNWREEVWLRDNFKCKIASPDCEGRIEAHHILGYREYPDLRYQIKNGITLCHFHHPRKRSEERELVSFFQELISIAKII